MSIDEILEAVQLVDKKQGQVVEIDLAVWEQIIAILENVRDVEEIDRAREEDDDLVPWEEVKADYWAKHAEPDV